MDKKKFWREKLAESRTALKALIDGLSEEQWDATVYSDGQSWAVRDILSHLVDSEAGMSIHVYKIRKGRKTVPEGFDLDTWNAGVKERVGPISIDELRERLDKVRARTLEGLESLEEAEWTLTGRHPVRGIITIDEYFDTIASHEAEHASDIKQALGL